MAAGLVQGGRRERLKREDELQQGKEGCNGLKPFAIAKVIEKA